MRVVTYFQVFVVVSVTAGIKTTDSFSSRQTIIRTDLNPENLTTIVCILQIRLWQQRNKLK
jgi:hypothetical protein